MSTLINPLAATDTDQGLSSNAITDAASIGKEDFLSLLVTQMQHQDPLDPIKNEDFVAQMAQFSSLEQLMNLNDTMTQVQLLQSSINNSQAVNLIGKEITVQGNSFRMEEGGTESLDYMLGTRAETVEIIIYDADGVEVRKVTINGQSAGKQTFEFDGKDDNGEMLADGDYTFNIDALDANGDEISTLTMSTVKVDGVTFDQGIVYLVSGNNRFVLGDVIEVRE